MRTPYNEQAHFSFADFPGSHHSIFYAIIYAIVADIFVFGCLISLLSMKPFLDGNLAFYYNC